MKSLLFTIAALYISCIYACKDERGDCLRLQSFGWCDTRQRAMKKYCSKTCGFCQKKIKYIVVKPTAKVIPVTQASYDTQCKDKRKDCARLEQKYGWCTKRKTAMKKLCRSTCGFCSKSKSFTLIWKATTNTSNTVNHGQCSDQMKQCPLLKRRGFCERNKNAMKMKCPKSCNMCHEKQQPQPKVLSKPVSSESECTNSWSHSRCAYYSHLGWCSKHPEIQEKCQKTCVCDKTGKNSKQKPKCSNTKNSPGCEAVCRDDPRFEVLCSRFGSDCDGNGGLAKSLKRYCPKTCRLCT